MRRIALSLAFLCLALFTTAPTSAQQNDAEIRQALVGTWDWSESFPGGMISHELTLVGDGNYTWTSIDGLGHLVTASGVWLYRDHWLMFNSKWSSALDPLGRPLVQGPIEVLEVGADFVRTPSGTAHRHVG